MNGDPITILPTVAKNILTNFKVMNPKLFTYN